MNLWQVAIIAALWFSAGVVYGWWRWAEGNHCRHRRIEGIYGDEANRTAPFRVRCLVCGQLLNGLVDDDVISPRPSGYGES